MYTALILRDIKSYNLLHIFNSFPPMPPVMRLHWNRQFNNVKVCAHTCVTDCINDTCSV